MKRLSNEEFLDKIKQLYGNSLDYSKVQYINSRHKVTLICPKHGEFQQYANNLLQNKGGCPKCKLSIPDLETFIQKAKEIHGDKYDYSKVNYVNQSTQVCIICPKHGEFMQTPKTHIIDGCGCKKCSLEKRTKPKPIKLSEEEKNNIRTIKWKEECSKIHNNKYDYSLISSISNLRDKVTIICPIHGKFEQSASHHKRYGCEKCSYIERGKNLKLSQQEIEQRFRKVHGDKYQYGQYKSMNEYIQIFCPIHGEFNCTPANHLYGCGCPKCKSSSGENQIRSILQELKIPFKEQVKLNFDQNIKNSNIIVVDFIAKYKDCNYIIEYNGIQHYKYIPFFHKGGEIDFKKQQYRDEFLRNFCKKENIILIEIPYSINLSNIKNILIKEFGYG